MPGISLFRLTAIWASMFLAALPLFILKSGLRLFCDGATICTRQYPDPSQYSAIEILSFALFMSALIASTAVAFVAARRGDN